MHTTFQKIIKHTRQKLPAVLLVILAGLLAGCINVQTNIALHGQEEWSGVQAIQLSAEFAQLMEQQQDAAGGPETSVDMDELDEWLQQAEQAADLSNMEVTFDEVEGEDGSLAYILQASGQEYALLNQVFFEGEADISVATVNGQRQVTIRHTFSDPTAEGDTAPQELSSEEQAAQQQMMEAFGLGIALRISGQEIISSNALRVEGSTAIWENPTTIEVTLTEAAEFSPETIAVVDGAASSGRGLSPEMLETLLESAAEDMEMESEPGAANSEADTMELSDEATAEDDATQMEAAGDTDSAAAQESEGDAADDALVQTEEAGETEAATEQADEADEVPADDGTVLTLNPEAEGEAPSPEMEPADAAQANENLPQSGTVLTRDSSSTLQLVFSGLVLAVLGGAAGFSLLRKKL